MTVEAISPYRFQVGVFNGLLKRSVGPCMGPLFSNTQSVIDDMAKGDKAEGEGREKVKYLIREWRNKNRAVVHKVNWEYRLGKELLLSKIGYVYLLGLIRLQECGRLVYTERGVKVGPDGKQYSYHIESRSGDGGGGVCNTCSNQHFVEVRDE